MVVVVGRGRGRSVMVHRSRGVVHNRSDMMVQRLAVHGRLEAVVIVGRVLNGALVTVGIDQRVRAVHLVVLARLVLRLHVAGVLVVHGVGEIVVRRRVVLDVMVLGGLVMVDGRRRSVVVDEWSRSMMVSGCADGAGGGYEGEQGDVLLENVCSVRIVTEWLRF